jgi:hypothetical protein
MLMFKTENLDICEVPKYPIPTSTYKYRLGLNKNPEAEYLMLGPF